MSPLSKLLTGAVISLGAIAGCSYLRNLKRAGAELEVVPKASVHQLTWSGLAIRLDVLMKNPTKGSFSIKAPFVKLLYKESVVGSSNPVDKEIRIPAYGEVMIEKIMVQIPITNVFSVAFALIKALIGGEAVILTIRTITTINLGIIKLPYEVKQEVTVKK